MVGVFLTVFCKERINDFVTRHLEDKDKLGIVIASLLGALSPVTIYGMLPLIVLLAGTGIAQSVLIAFMITSILINPNLVIFTLALGLDIALLRLFFAIFAGITGGLIFEIFFREKDIFTFHNLDTKEKKGNVEKDYLIRFMKGCKKAFAKTAPNLMIGLLLSALFNKYFPMKFFTTLFAENRGLSVLFATSLGVPLYYCGGGTIPIINAWMHSGMGPGAVLGFMMAGPATKFTNLGAVKAVLKVKHFFFYLIYIMSFALFSGYLVDLILNL